MVSHNPDHCLRSDQPVFLSAILKLPQTFSLASAFSKAPVGQSLWAQVLVGFVILAAVVVGVILTGGCAAGSLCIMGGFYAGITLIVAGGAAIIGDGVDEGLASRDRADDEAFIETQQKQETQTHGEHYANEWNYREKITTDFDNDTMECKKCVSKMVCEKTKWHVFTDRTCSKWATDDYVDERCTTVQF